MPHTTLTQFYQERLARGDRDTLVELDGQSWTTARFHERVLETAGWLRAMGVGRGDVVAVWMVNRIEWLVLLFALARVGATLAAVNTRYRSEEVRHIVSKSDACMLILEEQFRTIDFRAILSKIDLSALPSLRHVAVLNPSGQPVAAAPGIRVVAFAPGPEHAGQGRADDAAPDIPVILFVTSGTTKMPKLVAHCATSLGYNAAKVAQFERYGRDTRLLAALPLCGVFCLMGVLVAIASGGQVILMETFDAPAAAAIVMQRRITHLYGSEEMYGQLDAYLPADANLSFATFYGMSNFYSIAAVLGPQLIARGYPLSGLYGSSEVLAYVTSADLGQGLHERFLAGGGFPVAGAEFEMRIRDENTGALLPAEVPGLLEIRAPSNFVGYFNDPQETRKAFTEDGYFRTGDLAYLRPDGALIYQGRLGDAVRLHGYLVNPGEIEDVLHLFEGIDTAQFVTVPFEGAECPVAFVKMKEGAAFDERALVDYLKSRLAAYKVPKRIWCVSEFPMTYGTNGAKIKKSELRTDALSRLAA